MQVEYAREKGCTVEDYTFITYVDISESHIYAGGQSVKVMLLHKKYICQGTCTINRQNKQIVTSNNFVCNYWLPLLSFHPNTSIS